MTKEHAKGLSYMPYTQAIEDGLEPLEVKDTEVVMDSVPDDSLLKIIYARDARTGLPVGDLTYFVSDKANPEVKQFILQNLMQDTSGAANPSVPAGMDPDLAIELTRSATETYEDYVNRLQNYKIENEQIVKNAKSLVQSPQEPAQVTE